MGRASSSKKVARVAGTGGGRTADRNRPWGYIVVIAVIVVLGVALTWTSRSSYQHTLAAAASSASSTAPTVGGTPWYEGYAVDICGTTQKALVSTTNPEGYTTGGNGVVTIAPKTKSVAGTNATLGVLARAIGLHLSIDSIQLPGGHLYANGQTCGSQPGRLYVKTYAYPGAVGGLSSVDPTSVALANDSLVTIAFVPVSQKGSIPAPPKAVQAALTKIVTPVTTTTTAPATTTTTGTSTTTTKSKTTKTTSTTTSAATTTTTAKG